MPNIDTSGPPITNVNKLKLFGMGENKEVGWIFSNSLAPVAHELGDDPDLAVSQKLLTDSIADMEQSNDAAVVEATHQAGLAGDSAVIATEQAERVVAEFRTFVASSGYQFAGDYATGIEITQYNQIIRDENGEFWRVSGQVDLPYVTTGAGIPEDDALVPAGDAVLRQDLANPDKGAAMVARGVVAVDSIADLLSLPEGQRKEGLRYLVKGYHAGSDVGGGEFYWDADSTAADNGGTVFAVVGVATGRFVRRFDGALDVTWFGTKGDGATDDYDAINSALAAIESTPTRTVSFSYGTYFVTNTISPQIEGTILQGEGSTLIGDIQDGPVLLLGGGAAGGYVNSISATNLIIQGTASTGVEVNKCITALMHDIRVSGGDSSITVGFYFADTWGSSFSSLYTNGANISGDCFRIGPRFNANLCENWYTSNLFCETCVKINAPESHGNVFNMLTVQGGRWGLWVENSGYAGWQFNTVYVENVAHPIRFGNIANGRYARGIKITNLNITGVNTLNPYFSERDAAIDFDQASGCVVDTTNIGGFEEVLTDAIITGDGVGATMRVVVGPEGAIRGALPYNTGSGYTTASVEFTGSGHGAVGDVVLSEGRVVGINIVSGGEGYRVNGGYPLAVVYDNSKGCKVLNNTYLIGGYITNVLIIPLVGTRNSPSTGTESGITVDGTIETESGAFAEGRAYKRGDYFSSHKVEYDGGSYYVSPIQFPRIDIDS